MSRRRYYRFKKPRDRKMTEREKFQWVLTAIVFVVVFIFAFIYFFASNCIFEWPIRWDIKTCLSEQIQPAKEEAIEQAANFVP